MRRARDSTAKAINSTRKQQLATIVALLIAGSRALQAKCHKQCSVFRSTSTA